MYLCAKLVYYLYIYCNCFDFGNSFSFEPPNLKTVLFEEQDLNFHCWSPYEVSLLLNRRVMQDLIPRKIPRDLPMVLKYLKHVEELANKIPQSINQTLLKATIGDVLGGYLQAIVLPIANEAYYAGNADYATVDQLHRMLSKWKWYLSTDGSTWSQECDMRKIPTKVTPLDASLQNPDSACDELYVASPGLSNQSDSFGSQTFVTESSRIAIPYFDNNMKPSAIALPFRQRNLYSLIDPQAAYILVKYYLSSVSCLSRNPKDVQVFQNYFHMWIVSKVVPHLHDQEHWYPALGAVMRVVETIKQKGLTPATPVFVQPLGDDHQDLPNANLEVNDPSILKHDGAFNSSFHILNSPYGLIIIVAAAMMILLCICCMICTCCIMQCQKKKRDQRGFCFNDKMLKDAVISLYCGLKQSVSNVASKYDSRESQNTDFMQVAHNSPINYEEESNLSYVSTESGETSSLSSRDE